MQTMVNEDVTHFTSVDSTADPQFFTRFLDQGNRIPGIIASKPIILGGLRLRGGERVLDIGCGTGADAFELAAQVGPQGRVQGIDISAALIEEARRRATARGSSVSFDVGDAQALRFDDGEFDAVRTERMLMHVPDADRAVAEMARVLRTGGRLSVFDFDWETQFCDSPHKETTRKIAQSFCDGMRNGWIGRRLPRLLKENRLTDLSIVHQTITVHYEFLQLLLGGHVARIVNAGVLTPDEATRWWTYLVNASRAGTFSYGFTAFIVAGTKT